MKILYFNYGQYNRNLIMANLSLLGHEVVSFAGHPANYDMDTKLVEEMLVLANKEKVDCIFSGNFIPFVALVADTLKVPYVSWSEDSPSFTSLSPSAKLSCNRMYVFDREQSEKLKASNEIAEIYHMPLATDPVFFRNVVKNAPIEGMFDVSFVGNLYRGIEYDRIDFKEDNAFLKGYLEGTLEAQHNVMGYNFLERLLDEDTASKLLKMSGTEIPEDFYVAKKVIASYMLDKKLAQTERYRYLKAIGECFNLSVFTASEKYDDINAHWNGFVDYEKEMPLVFSKSRINLNFTPRMIHSGISLRVLDVMACGGFLLSNYQPEIDEFFEDGVDLVMFEDEEDMLEKIDYYLSHEEERQKIAMNGFSKVLYGHTYRQAFEKIFNENM